MRPTTNEVHIDTAMANISIAYKNEEYIAEQIFPIVNVTKQSDVYFTYTKDFWFRDEATRRAPSTAAKRIDYGIGTTQYFCVEYAIAKEIADEIRDNADNPIQPDTEATELCTDKILLAMERRVAALVQGTANWDGNITLSGTAQWSDYTNSDPLTDINTGIQTVQKAIGRKPNTVVMNQEVWDKLKYHPDIADKIKYTNLGILSVDLFKSLIDLPAGGRVLIGASIYDSAVEGATASMGYVWGKNCWIGYVAPSPSLLTPSGGYIFAWKTRQIRSWREEAEKQDVVEASSYYDEKAVASSCAYLIGSAIA